MVYTGMSSASLDFARSVQRAVLARLVRTLPSHVNLSIVWVSGGQAKELCEITIPIVDCLLHMRAYIGGIGVTVKTCA